MNSGPSDKGNFNLVVTGQCFRDVLLENGQLSLQAYIAAWHQLNCVFVSLGKIFKFVSDDVKSKLAALEEHLNRDPNSYGTISSFVDHEIRIGTSGRTDPQSATIALIRLHRALEFVIRLIKDIHESENGAKMSKLARLGYDDTLGKYHSLPIRTLTHGAFYFLPSRQKLVTKLSGNLCGAELEDGFRNMIKWSREVYDAVQVLYAQNNLLLIGR